MEIAVRNGFYHHVSQAGPGKYDFHHRRAAKEGAEGQAQQCHQGKHGIGKHFLPEDVGLRKAPGPGTHDIVLVQFFQHRRPHLPGVLGRHHNAQGHHGKDEVFQGNAAAYDGKEAQFQSENPEKHETHPEVRHRNAQEGETPDEVIKPAVFLYRRINAKGNGKDKHEQSGSRSQNEGSRQGTHKCIHHRLLHHEGIAEIPVKHPSQPVQILEDKGLIQPQLMTERIDFYLAHHDIFIARNHLPHRIPRRQHDQAERDKADAQKDKHHFSQPHD